MGAEILLYGYGLVCLSMLVFNLLYSLHLRSGDRRLTLRADALRRQVTEQLRRMGEHPDGFSRPVQAGHLRWMRRRLSRVSYLVAFDRLLDELEGQDAAYPAYIQQLQPVSLYLSLVYRKRENTQAAYYCHFLAKHKLRRYMEMDQTQQVILSYLRKDSLYCKINALKALCSFGSPSVLVDALRVLGDGPESQLHEKVVTEALLSYTGDTRALIQLLWSRITYASRAEIPAPPCWKSCGTTAGTGSCGLRQSGISAATPIRPPGRCCWIFSGTASRRTGSFPPSAPPPWPDIPDRMWWMRCCGP